MANNKPFVVWHVSEDEDYKLVLEATQICELEDKLGGRNLMAEIGNNKTGMPPLRTMLMVAHAAMHRYNHGVKMADVYAMFDRYVAGGKSQVEFYTDVYVQIFQASGFFPQAQAAGLKEALDSQKED